MLAFEVHVNNEKTVVAGILDLGNLIAIIAANSIKDVPNDDRKQVPIQEGSDESVGLTVGGITKGNQIKSLRWIDHKALKIGDEISIRLVESETIDAPDKSADMESFEKVRFDSAKEMYVKLKDKYEETSKG